MPEDRLVVLPEDLLAASDIGLLFVDHSLLVQGRGIEYQLRGEVTRAAHHGSPLAAIMLDCDTFKRANDRLGHAGGDVALSTIAQRIQSVLRASDSLARIGGDEFVVLLPGAPVPEAELVAERIRLAVAAMPIAMSHEDVTMTISAAVTAVDQSIHSLEQLLEQGLLASLDERCLISCLEIGETLRGSGAVHVNCYRSTLLNMSAERLAAIFEPAGRDVMSVVVELSEQQILGDPSSLIPVLQQVRAAGVNHQSRPGLCGRHSRR